MADWQISLIGMILRGLGVLVTDRCIDICNPRVAFASENLPSIPFIIVNMIRSVSGSLSVTTRMMMIRMMMVRTMILSWVFMIPVCKAVLSAVVTRT